MIRIGLISSVLAACLAVGTVQSSAAVILTAIEDNNVLKSASTTVQTNGVTFALKQASSDQSNARLGFLKFDLTGVTPADGDTATFSVDLGANASANDDFTLGLYALNAGTAGYNWTESAITYGNRPAPSSTTPLVDTALATLVGSPVAIPRSSPAGTEASFTIGNWDSFRQIDNTITFILLVTNQTSSTPSLTIAASENTNPALNPPTLTIAVPEPGSATLLLAAVVLLAGRGRRAA